MRKRTPSPATPASRRIARLTRWARLALLLEGLCERSWPLLALILLFTAQAALELPRYLPLWGHLTLLGVFAYGLGWSLWRLRRLKLPSLAEAHRRIEADSHLPHRPLSLLDDELTAGKGDPLATALWGIQRRRAADLAPRLALGWPRPTLPQADPLGLRFVPILLLALAAAGGRLNSSLPDRLLESLSPNLAGFSGPPPLLQTWITPPAYTRLAPQLLQSLPPGQTVTLPAGSTLLAELQGGHGKAEARLDGKSTPFASQGPDSQRLEMPIPQGSRLEVHQGFSTLGSWPLAVIADRAPAIAFAGPPQRDRIGRLKLEVLGHDDYGIAKLWLLIRPTGQPGAEAQTIELPLGAQPSPETRLTLWQDLTGNAWAGHEVSLQLAAENGAGLKALSAPMIMTLPERAFTNPVAQAVILQRKRLAQAPSDRSPVRAGLARIASAPEAFHGDTTVFLALSVSISRLRWDGSDQAVPSVLDILWQTALRIEEGERPMAEKTLNSVQRALEQALAENAPAAEIARLMAELQNALDQYMDALVQDALRHGLNGTPTNPDQPTVSPQDLQDMTEQIRELAATGSRDAAQAMLKRLHQLTEGLQVSSKAPSQQMTLQAQNLMNDLNAIATEQNQLLDQSFQENRRQQADEDRDGLPILGERQSGKGQSQGSPNAAARQEALRNRLGKAMQELGETGVDIPQAFGQAERAMRDSSSALGKGNLPDAVDAQTEAVARLQEGTRQTMKDLSQKLGGGLSVQPGLPGNVDPLGRPLPNSGGLPNLSDQPLPSQSDMTKAREVLETLRQRSGEAQRPPEERDYLQRLLKSFF
jgi:uncharacterized protein (TIGR02302 family)